MSDEMTEVSWPDTSMIAALRDSVASLPPGPWRVMPDPTREGKFYIAGPPDTMVIMDGLEESAAYAIKHVMTSLPAVADYWENVAGLWNYVEEGDMNGFMRKYMSTLSEMQLKVAALSQSTAVIPNAASAGDLSALHITHEVTVGGSTLRLSSVEALEGGFVRLQAEDGTLVIVDQSLPVEVHPSYPFSIIETEETADTEEDNPEETQQQVIEPPEDPEVQIAPEEDSEIQPPQDDTL